jgi:hypothetical protein
MASHTGEPNEALALGRIALLEGIAPYPLDGPDAAEQRR